MFQVLMVLMITAGAWMAWRRHPAYSTRSAARTITVSVLGIAAMAAVFWGAIRLTSNASPWIVGVVLGSLIVLSVVGLAVLIQSVSTPPEAQLVRTLPPNAKLLKVHRRRVYTAAKYLFAVIAMLAILFAITPGNFRYAFLGPGAMAVLIAVTLLPILYLQTRRLDQALSAVVADPWIHWRYTAEQWNRWAEAQGERLRASTSNRRAAEKLGKRLRDSQPEVYFGRDGVFCEGVFRTWLGMDIYLKSAMVDERDPRSLLFQFEKTLTNPYGSPRTVNVLIPPGADNDVTRLQRELTER